MFILQIGSLFKLFKKIYIYTEKNIGCKFNELDLLKKVSWFNGKIVKATNFFTNLTTGYFVDSLIQQTCNC